MTDEEILTLILRYLADSAISPDPNTAVGGDPSASWMDPYAYGYVPGIGPVTPSEYDPMADGTIADANGYDTGLDQSPSTWGQAYPTDVPMRTMYGLQNALVARQHAMPNQPNAMLGYDRAPMFHDLQYGLQQHQMHPYAPPIPHYVPRTMVFTPPVGERKPAQARTVRRPMPQATARNEMPVEYNYVPQAPIPEPRRPYTPSSSLRVAAQPQLSFARARNVR